MFRISTALLALIAFASLATAQTTDYSLNSSGWTNGPAGTTAVTGSQTIQAGSNAWGISPYTGSTMVKMQPSSPTATYSNMTSALGMSAASVSALSAEIAAQNPQGGGNITNTAWIYKDFPLAAATKFSMYWVYTSTDYVPFNDGSITTFVNTGNAAALGKINNVLTQYILLGATNPGTGNYSTGSYGSTGWQIVNYEAVDAGTYRLGFASFNQGDTALSPVLFVNDGLGSVTKNGQTFGAVAPNNPNMPTVNPTPTPPAAPTIVSTTPTTPTVVSSTAYGAPTTSNLILVTSSNTGKLFNVSKITTPVTVTPYTITTITTPMAIQNWSNNTTTTINDPNNPAVTTTSNGTNTNIGSSSTLSDTASSVTLKEAVAYRNLNPFIVDALNTKDGQWASPSYGYTKQTGSIKTSGVNLGYQTTVENNSVGFGIHYDSANTGAYVNSYVDQKSYAGNAYILSKLPETWLKVSVGAGVTEYTGQTSIPQFALLNLNKTKQRNYYADISSYMPEAVYGFRAFVGATVVSSQIANQTYAGSYLLTPETLKSETRVNPYAGVRYEFDENINGEVRVTQTKDYKTVFGVRAVAKTEVYDNTYLELSAGADKGTGYTAGIGMLGIKINF